MEDQASVASSSLSECRSLRDHIINKTYRLFNSFIGFYCLLIAGVAIFGPISTLVGFAAGFWALGAAGSAAAVSVLACVASSSPEHDTALPSMPRQTHVMINLLFMVDLH